NCIVDSLTYLDQKVTNSCNEGWILRTWTAKDKCGNTHSSSQKLLIKHRSDFEVLFPEDKLVDCESNQNADTGLTKAGIPIIRDQDCEQIGVRYEDEIFYTEADACYKIVRTWTIIDWCIFDANQHEQNPDIIVNDSFRANHTDRICAFRYLKDNNDGYMKYIQIIKVVDHVAPVVKCENVELCVSEGCSIRINVPLKGADNCSDTLNYSVDITYPDGSHNRQYNIQAIRGIFSVGVYQVTVIAEDGCHNADTCSFTLNIKDCKIPTPYCISGIVTVIMPSSGSLEVWAKDLDLNSTDNCSTSDKLRFTFSKNLADLSLKLTCKDIPNGKEQSIPVQVWVTDEAGQQNFCSTYLLIQDNTGNICPDQYTSTATLKGTLRTEQKEPIEFVNLMIKGQGIERLPAFQTNSDGTYYFGSLPLQGNYVVSASRNDNPLNGVSTLDLVLIQKHILGAEKLNSPYKMIAADVDGSNSITALDLLELRKLILGLYDRFPSAPSWKFMPGNYNFTDPDNPWGEAKGDPAKTGYPVDHDIQALSGDLTKNFIGIKMGDVNISSVPHSLIGLELRSSPVELTFELNDRVVTKGQVYKVAFKSPNFRGISGWQGTLSIGALKLHSELDILDGELHLSKGNIGTRWINNGFLTLSWNETRLSSGTNMDVGDDKTLFEFEFIATQTGHLSDMISMGSQHTIAESYQGSGEVGLLRLQFKDPASKQLIAKNHMDQNYPNPFNHKTMIGITLIQKSNGVFSIYDATGRVVYKMEKEWAKGYNQIQVDKNKLGGQEIDALYYYKFQSGSYTEIKKMILTQ
ncbi:MAG: T9SS type A sorting domain-containing protein, partial [Saprospiraceae bacterium]